MARRTALSREGAACERNIDCIVGSNDGYARVAARTRAKTPAECCDAGEALDRERFEAGALCESERESPAGVRKWMRFIAQGDRRA